MSWPLTVGLSIVPVAVAGGALYYACGEPTSQVLGPALVRGPAEGRGVALTFDDGPNPPFTEQILDVLRDREVPATFFVCGKNVKRFPQLLRQIDRANHAIGNHTYSHPFLYFKRSLTMAEEIDRTQAIIESTVGKRPKIFRPPYGVRWFGLFPLLRERGMDLIQWSDTGFDWKTGYGPSDITRATLKRLGAGSVILLHDGLEVCRAEKVDRSSTVAALPAIIDGVRKAGLTFVPLGDFLA